MRFAPLRAPRVPRLQTVSPASAESDLAHGSPPTPSARTCKTATMKSMSRRSLFRLSVIATGLLLVVSPLTLSARQERHYRGRKFKPPPPTSRITVIVRRNDNDTPIRNAGVVFQPIIHGHPRGGMELRSDAQGKAVMTVIPIGDTVLVQVIAKGYQTFGKIYKVEKPEMSIPIRLKLPDTDYSTYESHNSTAGSGNNSNGGGNNGANSSGGSAKDSGSGASQSGNGASGSANQKAQNPKSQDASK